MSSFPIIHPGSENGAGTVLRQHLSRDGHGSPDMLVLSHTQIIGKSHVSPVKWLKMDKNLQVLSPSSFKIMDGWKKEFHERIKRSVAKLKNRVEDEFDMSTSIPSKYIVVVVSIPVN